MSLAKILAPLTGSKRDATVLATAFEAARPFNAHVQALFVGADPREAIMFIDYGVPISPQVAQELVETSEELTRELSKAAQHNLAAAAKEADVKIVPKPLRADAVTASYREVVGHFTSSVARAANLADLVVFTPIYRDESSEMSDTLISTITKTGRPVLLSPVAPSAMARKVAVAWDGSVSAANALIAAIPFLKRAETIQILCVHHASEGKAKFSEAVEYLMLHGLSCTEHVVVPGAESTGEALLSQAASLGANLLVMGGYGHSRLRETIFGGVSQYMVSHATLPVLLVH